MSQLAPLRAKSGYQLPRYQSVGNAALKTQQVKRHSLDCLLSLDPAIVWQNSIEINFLVNSGIISFNLQLKLLFLDLTLKFKNEKLFLLIDFTYFQSCLCSGK